MSIENFENREALLQKRIEDLALQEGMESEDILSDMMIFFELSEEDEDALFYFEDLSEKLDVPARELRTYAQKLRERDRLDE